MSKPTQHPIRTARERHKRTQQQIANAIGVTKATISRWETGLDLPSPVNAKALVDELPGLTLDLIYAKAA